MRVLSETFSTGFSEAFGFNLISKRHSQRVALQWRPKAFEKFILDKFLAEKVQKITKNAIKPSL